VIAHALVDDADYPEVNRWRWHVGNGGYAVRTVAGRKVPLHRQIMGLESGDARMVDHRDHDPLNCQRANLRVCTNAENQQNRKPGRSSRFRGVRFKGRRWQAYGRIGARQISIGYFATEDEAADAAAAWRERHLPFSNERKIALT